MARKEETTSQLRMSMQGVGRLIDFKLDEFVRLGRCATFAGGMPFGLVAGLMAAITSLAEFTTEYDKVLKKFDEINKVLHPVEDPDVIDPPVLSEGERTLNQAKKLVEEAKKLIDDLDPEKALDKLKEAKKKIRDAGVRKAMKDKGIGKSWYDLLEEISSMIEYLEKLLK